MKAMIVKAVKLYEKGFMTQPFAMGGEDGMEAFEDLPDTWRCPRCKNDKT